MAEQEQLRWLLTPPGPGEAHIYVAIGEGTKLSPAVQEALNGLLAALQKTDDVQGFGMAYPGNEMFKWDLNTPNLTLNLSNVAWGSKLGGGIRETQ